MREEFEKLPSIAAELENSDGELYWCDKQNQYRNNRVFQDSQTGWMNGAWYAWQAAKAQAVPEPSIDLTGHDIKYITNFMCYEDQDNLDTEVTIQKCKSGFEGAGLYAWVAEYPEEGGIKISANSQEQNQ